MQVFPVSPKTGPFAPFGEADGSGQPARRADEVVVGGLAGIAAERSPAGIYRACCLLAARLPGVAAVAILRPDERGMLGVAYSPAGATLSGELVATAATSLHQRWIAAHAPDAPTHGPGPYVVDERPELMIVPFVRDDHLLGALVLAGREGRAPAASQSERISAGAIGVTAAQALEAVGLRQKIELSISRKEHDDELTAARKALSRELHDGPTQELALASITLDRLILALGPNQAASADARQARDLIDRAVLGMRKTIGKLRSSKPPAPSITGPLRELLAEIAPAAPGLEVSFQEVSGVRLAPEVERAMIGIVREALHNVRKHAHAESVRLEVRRTSGSVEIAVTDDGVGFAGDTPVGHFGLEQIRELAEETGGHLDVDSEPGSGTTVKAWIPLPKAGTTESLARSGPGAGP